MSSRFFGYGSLVNLSTHDYEDVAPATLKGWRRRWSHRVQRNGSQVSSLSIVRAPQTEIAGVTARVPNGDWAALDAREHGYGRQVLAPDALAPAAPDVSVYQSLPENDLVGNADFPILQSYLDCVLQGFLRLYGQDAPQNFIATTDGWETPIFQDRAAPLYPRAVKLSASEIAQFDALLADMPKL